MSDAAYAALEPVQWPVRETGGTPRLFADGVFATPSGRARFVAPASAPARPVTETAFPLTLNSGRLRDQWHTMTRTGLSPVLGANAPEPVAEIHEDDARAAGIADGGLMRIATAYGSGIFRASVTAAQRRGSLFVPIHWSDANSAMSGAGRMVHALVDPVSGQPAFKHTPARAESVAPLWRAFFSHGVRSRLPLAATGQAAASKAAGSARWRVCRREKHLPTSTYSRVKAPELSRTASRKWKCATAMPVRSVRRASGMAA